MKKSLKSFSFVIIKFEKKNQLNVRSFVYFKLLYSELVGSLQNSIARWLAKNHNVKSKNAHKIQKKTKTKINALLVFSFDGFGHFETYIFIMKIKSMKHNTQQSNKLSLKYILTIE